MASEQKRRLEIFTRENFQGIKYTYTDGTGLLPKNIDLCPSSISVKIFGNNSWEFYGCDKFFGRSFQLKEGIYPQLPLSNTSGVFSIKSVAPHAPNGLDIEMPAGDVYDDPWAAIGAWFIGPKGENVDFFVDAAECAFRMNGQFRKEFFPTDPIFITEEVKQNEAFKQERAQIMTELKNVCKEMQNSVHWGSIRYQAHQVPDPSMPAFLGYLAALLYDQNNTANEASPVTTMMEIECGLQMCKMLGYGGEGMPMPWGDITAGGTIANIEALWASRNLKYYPLAVQEGLKDERLSKARDYKVFVPSLGEEKKMSECTQWELLNLDVDVVSRMPTDVLDLAEVDEDTYTSIVNELSLASLGFHDLMTTFHLEKAPVAMCPMSKHYSWPKAAGLIGIGERNLIGISYDKDGRMCIKELEAQLWKCWKSKTPVISVVAVMGATETSAVDNLEEIVKLRETFRRKDDGLNFAINADGAWGGYMCTMLNDPEPTQSRKTYSAFIPNSPLSKYVRTQLLALKDADTITLDPHKTGLAPYPAGALCYRNETMKEFVRMDATYTSHTDDPAVGSYGIQGSKPGAAACGVYCCHKVLGLDSNGIGRVLGQCTYGAKLLYCVWLTLAKDDDNFVCVPMKPLPDKDNDDFNYTLEEAKAFIKEHILWKKNAEIYQNPEAMAFLQEIGPDMLIIAFGVNLKNNTNVQICNDIQFHIFERLSITNKFYDVKRVKMFLTESEFPEEIYGDAVKQFRERLGLPRDSKEVQKYLIDTNCNPYTPQYHGAFWIGKGFRQVILDAIGQVTDPPENHCFVGVGIINNDGEVFADYLPMFNETSKQYHVVTKLRFLDQSAVFTIREKQKAEHDNPSNTPVVFRSDDKETLGSLLRDGMKTKKHFTVWVGLPSQHNTPIFISTHVLVVDTPLQNHFDHTIKEHPEYMSYFLYGDANGAYLSHNMYTPRSFYQVVTLDRAPKDVKTDLLHQGINITIQDMPGTPVKNPDGNIVDPLTKTAYAIECPTVNGQTLATTISMKHKWAKTYFDGIHINK